MITEIEIVNYKSIKHLQLDLGRVNVFIGENGAGKSNVLEAIALGCAAAGDRLDNEFLAARGIRVTNPEWMRAGFPGSDSTTPIEVRVKSAEFDYPFKLENSNLPYEKWESNNKNAIFPLTNMFKQLFAEGLPPNIAEPTSQEDMLNGDFHQFLIGKVEHIVSGSLGKFVIFSPENTSLRIFQKEGQILPLGINGEGLLRLLAVHASDEKSTVVAKVKQQLQMLGWFEDFAVKAESMFSRLDLRDRYLDTAIPWLDHRSANEGFFFLLFYFTLFTSDLTPKFFAVDNIDASLNPKLCEKMTSELVKLAKINDKQCLLTTHNPAVLDGLNLEDDEQRLFTISRNANGETMVTRVHKPKTIAGQRPARLSELFLRGVLGGLPKGF